VTSSPAHAPRSIVLASASPRRAELLRQIGLDFSVRPATVDETPQRNELPVDLTERLARHKARALVSPPSPSLVIGADTIVVIDGRILSKPRDGEDARRMLTLLHGRTHEVITGLAMRAFPEETCESEHVISRVSFASLSNGQIDWYLSTGEGADKAGAYALQGIGALLIHSVEGSYTNVIGLPLERLYPHLRRFGLLP
jgi:septum formation protein